MASRPARVAASLLNDAGVREGLKARGIFIPEDTWFLAALHDTTTDEIRLYDEAKSPHALAPLKSRLTAASALARRERALTRIAVFFRWPANWTSIFRDASASVN